MVPIPFAIPILALLGFANAGEAVLARLANDAVRRTEQNLQLLYEVGHRLDVIERGVFPVYGVAVALTIGVLVINILRHRRSRVMVFYDGGLSAVGRAGRSASGAACSRVCGLWLRYDMAVGR